MTREHESNELDERRLASRQGCFLSLRFPLQVNGVTKEDQTFLTTTMADTCFTDNGLNLGAFPSGNAVTLTAMFDVTTVTASDGYNIQFLVGNDGVVPGPSTWALVLGAGTLTLWGQPLAGAAFAEHEFAGDPLARCSSCKAYHPESVPPRHRQPPGRHRRYCPTSRIGPVVCGDPPAGSRLTAKLVGCRFAATGWKRNAARPFASTRNTPALTGSARAGSITQSW